MNKYIVLLVFIFIFFFASYNVNAEQQTIGAFRTNSCITLKQGCANCTFVNISISVPPNLTVILVNQSMSQISYGTWVYQFCNTSTNGEYIYDTVGDPDGFQVHDPVNFIINPLGKILTNSQAILYFLVFLISFILFIIFLAFAIFVPSKNNTDQMTGYVIAISNMKYVKMFMVALAYLTLMLMTYFGWIVSFAYLDMDFLGTLFNFGFYSLVVLLLPLFIVGVYIMIANAVRDAKINEMLTRGLRVR